MVVFFRVGGFVFVFVLAYLNVLAGFSVLWALANGVFFVPYLFVYVVSLWVAWVLGSVDVRC